MDILLVLAVLVCPLAMGGSMLWMALKMRSSSSRDTTAGDDPP